MREAFLKGEPVFTRSQPLSKNEKRLLTQAQEPEFKARYGYYDCEQHGIFAVDNELGLTEITCPKRGKCKVREVFDPAGYAEHYTQTDPNKLTPAQDLQLDQILALGQLVGQSDEQLREQMEKIMGCKVKGSAGEMLAALQKGLAGLREPEAEDEGDKINRLLAESEARDRLSTEPIGFPIGELRRRLERILGVSIPASDEDLSQGFREGLAYIDYNKSERPQDDEREPDEPAPPPLSDIEHYASLQFSAEQVASILGLDYAEAQRDPDFKKQMLRGQLIQQAQVRETIFLHAKGGSAPAQEMAMKMIEFANVAAAGE